MEQIRGQVDQCLSKAAPMPALLEMIEQTVAERRRADAPTPGKRLAEMLRENLFQILQRALQAMRGDARLGGAAHLRRAAAGVRSAGGGDLAAMLEAPDPREIEQALLRLAESQGLRRYLQGYSIPLVAAHARHLERAMLDVVQDHLLALDLTYFLFDFRRIRASLGIQLEHALQAFLDEERQGRLPAQRPSA